MIDFDALRATHPALGFSVYAIDPGGPVTLEIVTPVGDYFQFKAATFAEAVALAFPYTPPAAPPAKPVDIFS